MKIKILMLTEEQKKAIETIVEKVQSAKLGMEEMARTYRVYHEKMWGHLKDFYPQIVGAVDCTFEMKDFELRFFETNPEVAKYRKLKEDAIKAQDWEKAAMYRDEEKKAKDKEKEEEKNEI